MYSFQVLTDKCCKPCLSMHTFYKRLTMSDDRKVSTRKYGSTIDEVSTRFLDKFDATIFISYFSHHKPIVPFFGCNNATINKNNIEIQNINSNLSNQIYETGIQTINID